MSYNNDYNNGYNSGYNNNNNYNNGYNNGYNNNYNYDYNYNNGYNNQYQYNNAGYDNNGYGGGNYGNGYSSSSGKLISTEAYNLIIGGVLLYGFIVNCIMTAVFSDSILRFVITNPVLFYIGYFVCAIAGTMMVRKSNSPVISFIGYNLIVVPIGTVISFTVTAYTMMEGGSIVTASFAITAVVTLVMMFVSSLYPRVFLSMGKTLGITLLVTIVAELILTLIMGSGALPVIDYIVVAIFCLYIGYDWAKANAVEKTADNAIDAACELYLDIVNLFLRIMRILARANRN